MKYVVVIPDGCADEPQDSLGGKTPLEAANIPFMDQVASRGVVGNSKNTPDSLIPASDVATLSLFGYDPLECYTGRAPLEAAASNIELGEHDWAIRCNLVTVVNEIMKDFSGGHVSSEHGKQLIDALASVADAAELEFHPGVSYRNLLIYRGTESTPAPFSGETKTQAPHDIPDQSILPYLPQGPGGDLLCDLMRQSVDIFRDQPVTKERADAGSSPVTQVWLWGQGQAPKLKLFKDRFALQGAIITAVDLLRGVGAFIGWDRIEVPTATGYLDTDYAAKGVAGIDALSRYDLVCVHVEAPDEASHEGRTDEKIKALEEIDRHVVGPMLEKLDSLSEPWRILISPDHPTPLQTRTHGRGLVPWAVAGDGFDASGSTYNEPVAAAAGKTFDPGHGLMPWFLGK